MKVSYFQYPAFRGRSSSRAVKLIFPPTSVAFERNFCRSEVRERGELIEYKFGQDNVPASNNNNLSDWRLQRAVVRVRVHSARESKFPGRVRTLYGAAFQRQMPVTCSFPEIRQQEMPGILGGSPFIESLSVHLLAIFSGSSVSNVCSLEKLSS